VVLRTNDVTFFSSAAKLRNWFRANHASARELWVGFYKKKTRKPSVTWPESVDEALSVGWIDGIRKRIDAERYAIRFTPRRPGSIWSAINIRRVEFLTKSKRMRRAGITAFEARRENRSGIYAYEQRPATLVEPYGGILRDDPQAAAFFEKLPPSHRRTVTWWIVSAKREGTRLARLHKLIDACRRGKRLF
jgi:uncharacterized protein YdeI (YjbR/CyaY-like superfamily)